MAKFTGKQGDDTLIGTNHDDWLFGLAGNDQLYGRRGNDLLVGGLGSDTLRGGRGNDTLLGGFGNDRIDGGLDNDCLAGDAGADTFVHRAGDGFDTVAAGTYDSQDLVQIAGEDYYDFNYDWTGTDLHVAAAVDGNYDFADTGSLTFKNFFTGGPGFITVQIDTVYNEIYGTDPALATLRIERGLAGINNAEFGEIVVGTDGDDVVNGNGGFYDALYGKDGNDVINGGDGLDHVRGGTGDDVINGFDGDDRIRPDAGNDVVDGGNGVDLVRYDRAAAGVWVVLSDGVAYDDGEGGQDTLFNIENARGSDFADKLVGGSFGDNVLAGRDGDDTLDGGPGDDVLLGQGGADSFHYDIEFDGNDFLIGFESDQDRLIFHAIADVGDPGLLDDIQPRIVDVADLGAGSDVVVTFDTGASLTFAGLGTGTIDDIGQLVADPSTQIIAG